MTYRGFLSRLRMFPRTLMIAYQSLSTGTYTRPYKYLKFTTDFQQKIQASTGTRRSTLTQDELYTIASCLLATCKLDGDIAELGVYQGATAKLICEYKNSKQLYLFDTFVGMPEEKITDADDWESNTHRDTNMEEVRSYLCPYGNVTFIPGVFPESATSHAGNNLENNTYSFVHLDVDLYQSTLDGLEYFYPRLVTNGRLVSHNFNLIDSPGGRTPGVREAFLKYFCGSKHKLIELAETQCMVIKS